MLIKHKIVSELCTVQTEFNELSIFGDVGNKSHLSFEAFRNDCSSFYFRHFILILLAKYAIDQSIIFQRLEGKTCFITGCLITTKKQKKLNLII